MTDLSSATQSAKGDELASLMKEGLGTAPSTKGYVDVLGETEAIGPHAGQRVFLWKIPIRLYTWIWRPVVSRLLLGLRGPNAAEERRETIDALALSRGDTVVDVGCGPGNYTRHLAMAVGDGLAVGIDASPSMIASAVSAGGARCAYVRGDASDLPFEDATFDAACSVGVIHLLEEPMAAVAEMTRVLAPGGRLAIGASCAREGRPGRKRGGLTIFGRDELTDALDALGMVSIEQQVFHRGQLVSARKPEEGSNDR